MSAKTATKQPETAGADNWCADFFNDAFADHYLERDAKFTELAADFLERHLALLPGMRVFDQCCGIGNVSHALARRGYRMTGIDLIPSYIARAAAAAAAEKLPCTFFTGDARMMAAPEPCDAAFNWWTSFGYFEEDAENRRMLQRVADSLKTGGRFVLDYMNREERIASFAGGTLLIAQTPEGRWESFFDRARDMVVKSWHYQDTEGRPVRKDGSGAKLYSTAQLENLLQQAGFTDVSFRGDWRGGAYTAASPRCIALAAKA